jgi:hypothetical protein
MESKLPADVQEQIKAAANGYARIPLPYAKELGLAYYDGAIDWAIWKIRALELQQENEKLKSENERLRTYIESADKALAEKGKEGEGG